MCKNKFIWHVDLKNYFLSITLQGSYYKYYPHITDDKTEDLRGKGLVSGHTVNVSESRFKPRSPNYIVTLSITLCFRAIHDLDWVINF